MLRRLIAVFAVACWLCAAEPSPYERLAAAAKLWAYVKYLHPGVTADGIDWDAAFTKAAPKILAAKDDEEFTAATAEMLSALHDPMTRIVSRQEMMQMGGNRAMPTRRTEDGVTVVTLEPGNFQQAVQGKNAFSRQLAGDGIVLFDLRDTRRAPYVIPESLPVAQESIGPATMMRVHSGYANDANSGSGGYKSYWEMHDGARSPAAAATGIRAVFLVNHVTDIPRVALAVQASGAGAIISEDEIDDRQIDLSRPFRLPGSGVAAVRAQVLSYSDGTTGLVPNIVLHETGGAAFKAALAIAKSGKWPQPPARPKLNLPPARFIENNYIREFYPTPEYRMLAAARTWGVFYYFHPYRHLYGEDWDAVLVEFLAKLARAEDAREYHLGVAEMVAHVHDTHCFVGSAELSAYYGLYPPPVELRWIENQPVVTRIFDKTLDVRPGDILVKIESDPFRKRADDLARHISASTEQSMMARVMGLLLMGDSGSTVRATFRRGNEEREVTMKRGSSRGFPPDRAEDPFRLINPKIGYVDLIKITNDQADAMFDTFKNTEAVIMDMRGYPKGTAWSIAPRLAEKQGVVAAHFRRNMVTADALESSGIMSLMFEQRIPVTAKPVYKGKTVMLIDERAISQSEHSGLFYRAANGTKFIGTPTVGANGDVTNFMAPGGISINFSGHDVRWPDGRQLQRVGLTPDIEVRPTIEGIRDGRDEVMERAIAFIENGR